MDTIREILRDNKRRKQLENAMQHARDVQNLSTLIKGNYKLKKGRKERKGRVKAILAFDTTLSMGDYRQRIRQDLNYLVDGMHGMLERFELAVMGCGDHCDGPGYLQINPYSSDVYELKKQIASIADTDGGDEPEAFECLFHELNNRFPLLNDSTLILLTDSIPHGMMDYHDGDYGCRLGRDYQVELEVLKKRLNGFYIINCGDSPSIRLLQKTMVDHDKYLMDYDKVGNLATLVMGMCMSEAGRLDYMMNHVEK